MRVPVREISAPIGGTFYAVAQAHALMSDRGVPPTQNTASVRTTSTHVKKQQATAAAITPQ
jgi:hypothetical protein